MLRPSNHPVNNELVRLYEWQRNRNATLVEFRWFVSIVERFAFQELTMTKSYQHATHQRFNDAAWRMDIARPIVELFRIHERW